MDFIFMFMVVFGLFFFMYTAVMAYNNAKEYYKQGNRKVFIFNVFACIWMMGMFVATLWILQKVM